MIVGVLIGGVNNTAVNIKASGDFDVGVEVGGVGNNVSNVQVNVGGRINRGAKIARNQPCPCGSGIKYKRCHGGVDMAIGIRVSGDDNTIDEAKVVATGLGIDVSGNRNKLSKLDVYVSDSDVVKVLEDLKLPIDTPPDLVRDAIAIIRAGEGASDKLVGSGLGGWLHHQGINGAFWIQQLISLVAS